MSSTSASVLLSLGSLDAATRHIGGIGVRITYGISGGMTPEHIRRIHDTALRILDEIGFQVRTSELPETELFERLSAHEGVRIRGRRLCFAPHLVERCLAQYRERLRQTSTDSDGPLVIRVLSHAFHVLNSETDALRPCTTRDLIEFTRLSNTFSDEGLLGGCPGFPCDAPPGRQAAAQYRIGCEYSRTRPVATPGSTAEADLIYDMAQIMGYASRDAYSVGVHPVSPLRLEGNEFDIAIHLWKKLGNRLAVSAGPMPILGVTAPVFYPGAFAQAIAEALGCFVFFSLLVGGVTEFWFNCYAFDMRHGSFVYGGPEDVLIALMRNQLNQWYGLPNTFADKALNTMAHALDAHAAAEKAAKSVVALLAGARMLAYAGALSLDETFSCEQLAVDMEIVRWAKRVAAGFEFDDMTLGFDVISEVVKQGGDFLSHDSTLAHFQDTLWSPHLFEHQMRERWQAQGGRTLRERAHAMVRERLSREDHQIPDATRNALNGVFSL